MARASRSWAGTAVVCAAAALLASAHAPAAVAPVPDATLHVAVAPVAPVPPSRTPGADTVEPPRLDPQPPPAPALPAEGVQPAAPALAPEPDAALRAELERLRVQAHRAGRAGAHAAWLLGLAALHGVGGPVQAGEAQSWFERARTGGEPLAPAGLAWCAIEGCGGPPSPPAAQRWIAALRGVDTPRAQYLEWLLRLRTAPLQMRPPRAAPGVEPATGPRTGAAVPGRALLESAARARNPQAQLELGLQLAADGRDDAALAQFRAAEARLPAAAANVRILAQRAQQPRRAPAAQDMSPGAFTFLLAQRAHRGEGQTANFTEAIRLYRQAQVEGSVPAARMLALIFSRTTPDGSIDIAWMQELANVGVTREVPVVDPSLGRGVLRREPTALSDLLPARWRGPREIAAPRER